MKNTLLSVILFIFSINVFAQDFEGISPSVYLNIKEDKPVESPTSVSSPLSFKKLRNIGNAGVAVIVGNKNYDHFNAVKFAHNDAALMNQLLTQSFGFKNENITLVEDAGFSTLSALFGNVNGSSGKIAKTIIPGVTKEVWIYYSGHAGPNGNDPTDKKAYLIAKDTHKDEVGSSAYPLETLYKNLSKLNVEKVVVILDACFSGIELGYTNSATIQVDDPFKNAPLALQNGVVLTAAGANEFAT
jgi:hypothetical protein